MEKDMKYETFLLISFVINFFGFLYCFFKKLLFIARKNLSKRHKVKVFKCRDFGTSDSVEASVSRQAIACVKLFGNTVIFISAFYISITTNIISMPFTTYNCLINSGLCILVGTNTFVAVLHTSQNVCTKIEYKIIVKNIVTTGIVIVLISTKEAALIGVLIMFMSGSDVIEELRNLIRTNSLKKKQLLLMIQLLTSFLCLLVLPIIMFVVPLTITKENLFSMNKLSIAVVFTTVVISAIDNVWRLKILTIDFITDMSKAEVRKRNHQLFVQMDSFIVNKNGESNRTAGFVQISKTRFIRKLNLASVPCETTITSSLPVQRDNSNVQNQHDVKANSWTTINLD